MVIDFDSSKTILEYFSCTVDFFASNSCYCLCFCNMVGLEDEENNYSLLSTGFPTVIKGISTVQYIVYEARL